MTRKDIRQIIRNVPGHWVGDGFPVRSMISYNHEPEVNDPFLLLDYAGPANFPPAEKRRGVEVHPHRGFETVTIVYQGELSHRDSGGHAGHIGPGDVQWMTAASGVVHEEFHSDKFTRTGGPFEVVQLWVNLPAKEKMSTPRYQELLASNIPTVNLPDGAGTVRVIAGEYAGNKGPARTVTPINLWDVKLRAGATLDLPVPAGHTTLVTVQKGKLLLNGQAVSAVELAQLERQGDCISLEASMEVQALILTGEPIGEPVVGHGPFVMNSREEISQAIRDYQAGRMGTLA
ncbi:MAG: pirin family protein [Gemmatales bacterium]